MPSTRRRRGGPALVAVVALIAAGCGGDDEDPGDATEGSGAAQGLEEGAVYDITVSEFIAELQPQKQEILTALAADSEACEKVDVDSGFVLLVTAEAIDADPEMPLPELVEGQC